MLANSIVEAFWFMIPSYIANPTAVLFGGGLPMDFNRTFFDGRRVFGDGKTWRGLGGGILSGVLIGSIQWASVQGWNGGPLSFGSFPEFLLLVSLLPTGSLLGDLAASFIKRRMGKQKGEQVLGLDQYDFLLGTFLIMFIFQRDWFLAHYIAGEAIFGLIFIIVITPFLHRVVNIIGYKIGKKEVPW